MKNSIQIIFTVILLSFIMSSCDKNDDDMEPKQLDQNKFYALEAPYILCIGHNPGGIILDFLYKGEKGGANNFDYPSVKDIDPDLMIKNKRGHVYPGFKGGGGMPHMILCKGAQAVNYSAIDSKCKGYDAYKKLTKKDLPSLTFKSDDPGFDLSKLEKGESGNPLIPLMLEEFKKLVIGNKWKEPAHNDINGDELVWIIKTKENKLVKMIVTQFPAKDGERVLNGQIAMNWDLLD